jgi:hypothetical protein
LDELAIENDKIGKSVMKKEGDFRLKTKEIKLKVGDSVLAKQKKVNKSTSYFDPNPYIITNINGNMVSVKRNDKEMTRNISFFKKWGNRIETKKNIQQEFRVSDPSSKLVKTNRVYVKMHPPDIPIVLTPGVDSSDSGDVDNSNISTTLSSSDFDNSNLSTSLETKSEDENNESKIVTIYLSDSNDNVIVDNIINDDQDLALAIEQVQHENREQILNATTLTVDVNVFPGQTNIEIEGRNLRTRTNVNYKEARTYKKRTC